MIGFQPVYHQVVNERAGRREEARVLCLAGLQLRRVVARDLLQGGQRIPAGDFDLAHVADVEQAGAGADGYVFGRYAAVLEWHLQPAVRLNLRAGRAMARVERRLLKRRRGHVGGKESMAGGRACRNGTMRVSAGQPAPRRETRATNAPTREPATTA